MSTNWKLSGRPKTLRVTKTLANQFAGMEPAPHDRPLSERRLQVYQRLFAEGRFRPVTWASAYCEETGGTYRVNGKHTSTLLAGIDKLPEFFVVVEEYICPTLEDVAKLYATFDSAMQSRNSRDIYMSFAATVPALAEYKEKIIISATAGLAYAIHHDNAPKTHPADRAELLLEHSDFVTWMAELLLGGEAQTTKGGSNLKHVHLYRAPVVAAMFNTWSKAKGAASEFWTAVRDETGSRPNDPDRRIARWLLASTLHNRRSNTPRQATTNRETYAKVIHAWNAWRNN